ncbi:hypothetical protein U1Q18_018172 [Sarracenia purpurea var. burkii]
MNRKSKFDRRKGGDDGDDEVDLLLRAAEDDVLLNLSVDSHMSRGVSQSQSSYIDPDLDRRFQSLLNSSRSGSGSRSRSASKVAPKPQALPTKTARDQDDEKTKVKRRTGDGGNISDDDLFGRFAALKGSIHSSSSSSSSSSFDRNHYQGPKEYNSGDEKLNRRTIESDGVNEDEVQKVIQWAIDAARLDPSPSTDTDDDADSSYDDDSDHCGDDHQKKGERKKGQNGK